MTTEEIDRAIAEHLGWELVPLDGREFNGIPVMAWKDPGGQRGFPIPTYSTNLNAMHEAVASLAELELSRYADEVCDLAHDGHHDADIQMILRMGAKELAECYVKAIGKWRDK